LLLRGNSEKARRVLLFLLHVTGTRNYRPPNMKVLFFLLATASVAFSFVPKPVIVSTRSTATSSPVLDKPCSLVEPTAASTTSLTMMIPRGGATAIVTKSIDLLTTSLQSGLWGVVGLWAVSSAVVVPFTLYRQGYSFSVGYGYSVMAMAIMLAKVFKVDPLLSAAIFYGARLGSYLLFRNIISPKKAEQTKSFDKTFPRIKRIPFASSVALFYAFLMTPALYAMRGIAGAATGNPHQLLRVGTIVAWAGAVLEAVADSQKLLAKSSSSSSSKSEEAAATFVGPTAGVYRLTRHPNYTGELVFWFGLLLAGIPSFGKSPIAWICSLLGMYGIYGIMTNATKRLDKRQLENYAGQESYDTWRAQVKSPIFPFVHQE